jgi:alkylation response protein AidB-like acyl-CoA dehydrogenase
MDPGFNEEQKKFRQEVIQFCKEEMASGSRGPDFAASFRHKIAEKGWTGLSIPGEYGGLGLGAVYRVIFMEEMAYWRAPIAPYDYGVTMSLLGNICLRYGSEAQKKEYLPRIARGELFCGQGYSEPQAGNDLSGIQTRAVREGDNYIINGQKMWIHDAQTYRYTLLMARTDPDVPLERGISLFILDNTSPGVTVMPQQAMSGQTTPQVFLDNVRVPAGNLLGEENRGWEYYQENKPFYWNKEQGAETGMMRRAFDNLLQYVKETTRDGHPLSQSPTVRQKLARMATDMNAVRLLMYRMAWMETEGLDIFDIASIARVFHVEAWVKFVNSAMQILGLGGQLGLRQKYAPLRGIMEALYRQAALQLVQRAGPSYVKSIIATHRLGLPEAW